MAILRSLSVSLKARTSKFTKGLARARKSLNKFGKSIPFLTAGLNKLTLAMTALATIGIVALISRSLKAIDTIGKLSDVMGITTTDLQAFRLGAQLAGASMAEADKSMQIFTRRLGEAANGVGEAQTAIKQLNLNISELIKLPTADAMSVVADAINNLDTAAEQAAASFSFFGRQGVSLANFIKGGSKAMQAAREDAKRLGLEFSRIDAAVIEEVNDNILRMQALLSGLLNKSVLKLGPAFLKMTEQALEALIPITNNFDKLELKLKDILKPVDIAVRAFGALGVAFGIVATAVGGIITILFALLIPMGMVISKLDMIASLAKAAFSDQSFSDASKESLERTAKSAEKLGAAIKKSAELTIDAGKATAASAQLAANGISGASTKIVEGLKKVSREADILNAKTQEAFRDKNLENLTQKVETFQKRLKEAQSQVEEGRFPQDRLDEFSKSFDRLISKTAIDFVSGSVDKGMESLRKAVGVSMNLEQAMKSAADPTIFEKLFGQAQIGIAKLKDNFNKMSDGLKKNMADIISGMLEASKTGLEKVNEKLSFVMKNQAAFIAQVGAEGFKKIVGALVSEAKSLLPERGGGSANVLGRGLSLEALRGENRATPQRVLDPQIKVTNALLSDIKGKVGGATLGLTSP